jgi:hypothetical protein
MLFLSTFPAVSQAEIIGSGPLKANTLASSSAQYDCYVLGFRFVGNASVVAVGDWLFLNQTVFNSCVGNADVVMFAV